MKPRFRILVALQYHHKDEEYREISHQSLFETSDHASAVAAMDSICSFMGSLMRFAQSLKDVL